MISILTTKLKPLFIIIFYIIQHEEERFQHSSLSDDERKEGSKGCTNEETHPDSETYHDATYHYGAAILRVISI